MKFKLLTIALAAFLLIAGDGLCSVGKVTKVIGRVDVLKVGQSSVMPVKEGDPVDVGDIFRTKTGSAAEITFNNNNILRIAASTRVEIKEYMADEERTSQVVKLYRGRLQAIAGQEFIKKVAAFAEGNKFEVHTPNAVAGIRGSTMLVGILAQTTVVVFVEGHGYVYNVNLPALVVPVSAGMITYVVGEATPTPPAPAPESFTKESGQVFLKVEKTETPEERIVETEVIRVAEKAIPQAPPEEERIPVIFRSIVQQETVPPRLEEQKEKSSLFTGDVTWDDGLKGVFSAAIRYGEALGTFSISGSYTDKIPDVLLGGLSGKSSEGGVFYGNVIQRKGSLLAGLSSLYVLGKDVYFLTGQGTGTYDESTYNVSGVIERTLAGSKTLESSPELLDALRGSVIRQELSPRFLTPYVLSDSGIKISPSDSYALALSLETDEGKKVAAVTEHYAGSYEPTQIEELPYLGHVSLSEYAVGALKYSHDQTQRTFTVETRLKSVGYDSGFGRFIGTYSMKYTGKYDDQSFRMVGSGSFVAEKAGLWGKMGSIRAPSLYYDSGGSWKDAGTSFWYLAGTKASWTEPTEFLALGTYSIHDDRLTCVLSTEIFAGTEVEDGSCILGTVMGYASAIWRDKKIFGGKIRALYTGTPDQDGNVSSGIMKGTFSGSYYPFKGYERIAEIYGRIAEIKGILSPERLLDLPPSGVLRYSGPYGILSGTYDGPGIISATTGASQILFPVYDQGVNGSYGIFKILLGESEKPASFYDKPASDSSWKAQLGGRGIFRETDKNDGEGYWLCDISGKWSSSGEISGTMTGKALTSSHLYDIEGEFVGISSDSGTWIGQVIGSYFSPKPLSFVTAVGVLDGNGFLLYDEDSHELIGNCPPGNYRVTQMTGLLGGGEGFWDRAQSFIMMGVYGPKYKTSLWGLDLTSIGTSGTSPCDFNIACQSLIKKGISFENAEYRGFVGGISIEDQLEGRGLALYVRNTQNGGQNGEYETGVLRFEGISGRFHELSEDFGIWEAEGTISAEKKGTTGISPYDLYVSDGNSSGNHALREGEISGRVDGDLKGTAKVYHLSISDQNWGVWVAGAGGDLNVSSGRNWKAVVGGEQPEGDSSFYWIGYLDGEAHTNHKLLGTMKGWGLGEEELIEFSGDLFGTYGNSKWQATLMGESGMTPLTVGKSIKDIHALRPEEGEAFEGSYRGYFGNRWTSYEFFYVKTPRNGIGDKRGEDSEVPFKTYFPDGMVLNESLQGLSYSSPWDIDKIESLGKLPDWMKNLSYDPEYYSRFGPINVLEKSDDTLSFVLGATGYPWEGGMQVYLMGKYLPLGGGLDRPAIFRTAFDGEFHGGKGDYRLNVAGIITDDSRGVMAGVLGLFISDGKAGIFRTSDFLEGKYHKGLGMWEASGEIKGSVLYEESVQNPEVKTGVLVSRLQGYFLNNDGSPVEGARILTYQNSGSTSFIRGQDWGIFNSTIWLGGAFRGSSSTLPERWIASVSGIAHFGDYKAGQDWIPDQGFFLIPALEGTSSSGLVKGPYTGDAGIFMTMTKMGTISDVGLIGIYQEPSTGEIYSWQGVFGGFWKKTNDLRFASSFDSGFVRYGEIAYGTYSESGRTIYHYSYDNDEGWGTITFYEYADDGSKKSAKRIRYEKHIGLFDKPGYEKFEYSYQNEAFSNYSISYEGYPSEFSGQFFIDLAKEFLGIVTQPTEGSELNFMGQGNISAIMGGVDDLYGATVENPAKVYFLGNLSVESDLPLLFGSDIMSQNVENAYSTDTYMALDGKGFYIGYLGGRKVGKSIDGLIYALCVKNSTGNDTAVSNFGILKGTFEGSVYESAEMWQGEGKLYPVWLKEGSQTLPYYSRQISKDTSGNRLYVNNASQKDYSFQSQYRFSDIPGSDGSRDALYGVWTTLIGGKFESSVSDQWSAALYLEDQYRIINIGMGGTKWSNNKIEGLALGYGADVEMADPATWISVGDVKGVFKPDSPFFTLGLIGALVETKTFLSLAGSQNGMNSLNKLSIPAVEVGCVTLSGSGNNFYNLKMENTKFFAPAQGGAPVIWATGNVTGSYTNSPALNNPITLMGQATNANLTVNFSFRAWDPKEKKWLSSITGGGTLNSWNIEMTGVGAGKIEPRDGTSGTISGTAVGVVKVK